MKKLLVILFLSISAICFGQINIVIKSGGVGDTVNVLQTRFKAKADSIAFSNTKLSKSDSAIYASISKVRLDSNALAGSINLKANDTGVVHKYLYENIFGQKIFKQDIITESGIRIGYPSSGIISLAPTTSDMMFGTGSGAYKLRLSSDNFPKLSYVNERPRLGFADSLSIYAKVQVDSLVSLKQSNLFFNAGLTNTSNVINNNLSTGVSGGQYVIGGTGITDALNIKGTTGNGTLTSPAINLNVGNNGATNAVTVLNNGNVGIGTTTPAYTLDVNGVGRVVGQLTIPAATSATSAVNKGQLDSVANLKINGTGTTNYLSKWTGTNLQGKSLLFDNGVNVGIGTATPDSTLHIAGGLKYENGTQALGRVLTSDANGGANWAIPSAASNPKWDTAFYKNRYVGDTTFKYHVYGGVDTVIDKRVIAFTTIGTSGPAYYNSNSLRDSFNIPNYASGATGDVTLAGAQTFTGVKTIDTTLKLRSYRTKDMLTMYDRQGFDSTRFYYTTPLGGGADLHVNTGSGRFAVDNILRLLGGVEAPAGFALGLANQDFQVDGIRDTRLQTSVNNINVLHGGYNKGTELNSYTGYPLVLNAGGVGNGTGNVGIGTATPKASAILDISSTTQGVLLPVMNTTQRLAIPSPAIGLKVFDSTYMNEFVYNGVSWGLIESVNLKAVTDTTIGYVVTKNDNIVSIDNQKTAVSVSDTIRLPSAVGLGMKKFTIINNATGGRTMKIAAVDGGLINGLATSSIVYLKVLVFFSDGTKWRTYSSF